MANRWEVAGEELGALLAGKGVPVVLLNACQSGMTHPESLYPSIGNQLLRTGATRRGGNDLFSVCANRGALHGEII